MTASPRARRWIVRAFWAAGALVLLAALVVLLVHTPPVRRAVLRRVLSEVEQRFGVALGASQLRYNLFSLRIGLDDVTVAARGARDEPFLSAARIEVAVSRSALLGAFSLDSLAMENARITILRRADGSTNVPGGSGDDGEPAALPVDRILIPDLSFSYVDLVDGLNITLDALAVDVGPDDGALVVRMPGRIQRGTTQTEITRLDGTVTFDGRDVELSRLEMRSTEATITVDGMLALLVGEPGANLRFTGVGDIGGLARWGTADPPSGTFAIDGVIEGPFAAPAVIARIREGVVTVEPVTFSDIDASVTVNRERLAISEMDATFAGGRVTAEGQLPFGSGEADVTAAWEGLDLAGLVDTAAPSARLVPAARATGNASFRGPLADVERWALEVRTRLDPGRSAPGQVALGGDVQLGLDDGAWRLTAQSRVAGAPVDVGLRGVLDSTRIADSTVAGTIAVHDTPIPLIAQALQAMAFVEAPSGQPVAGVLQAEANVVGTLSAPRLQVTARGRDLDAAGVSGMAAEATGEGTAREMTFDARVSQGGANAVAISGTVWPADARIDAHVEGRLAEPSRVTPVFSVGGTVTLDLDASGPFEALSARGTVDVDDARYDTWQFGPLNAVIGIDPAAARVQLTASDLAAGAAATISRTGDGVATIDLALDNADLARFVRDAGLPVALTGRVSLTAHAEGPIRDWAAGTADVQISQLEATAGELPIALRAPATLAYVNRNVEVRRFDVAAGETSITVGGRLPLFGDAAPVAAADALRAMLVGDIAQALEAVRATGLVDVPDAGATGPLVVLARVSGSGERPVLAGDLELGPGRVVLPLADAVRVKADATGDAAVRPKPDTTGDATVRLPSSPCGLRCPGKADTTTEEERGYALESVQVRAHLEDGWLDLLNASAEWQGSRFSAQGRAPLGLLAEYLPTPLADATGATTGVAVLDARATGIGPQVLAPFVSAETLAQLDGSIDASARVTAGALAAEALEGEIRLDTLDLRIADLPISQREPTRITLGDGFARVAAWDWTGQGASLGVQGQVRLADREATILAAGRVDLRTLTPFLRDAGLTIDGALRPLVAISGPLDEPSIDAEVTLADASLRLAKPRVVATGLTAKAVVSPTGADISSLTGSVNGGALTGKGRASFGGDQPAAAALEFDIAGMALEFPEGLRSELDADLALGLSSADEGARGTLSGTVTVLRSAYREPIAIVTGLLTALRSDRLTATIEEPETLADRLALDVRLVTDTDVVVDNNLARLQLGADLRVIGTVAAPALSGRADLREGGELRLGRNRYEIAGNSTIDFQNPDEIEPDLNIQANTSVAGVGITLTLTGTPDAPAVNLDAPEQLDLGQADLASLLLTGRDLQSVSGAEAEIVGEQVVSYLSGDLLGAASRVVGLDTIRFGGVEDTLRRDPATIATETDPTSRMTFGKALGEALEITLSQSLRDADAQTWIVDYRAFRQLGLRLVSDDEHLRSYELTHDLTFGTAVERRPEIARNAQPPARVEDVTIAGNPGPLEGRLRSELRLTPGDTFDFGGWQRDRDRLEQVLHEAGYREARVDATRDEGAGGVSLSYVVQPGPLTRLITRGYDLRQDTVAAIESAWTQSVFDDFLEEEAAAIVREALAAEGYLEPSVAAEIATGSAEVDLSDTSPEVRLPPSPFGLQGPRKADTAGGDVKTLTITIAPGQRTSDRRLVIAAPDEELAAEIDDWVAGQQVAEAAWREPAPLEQAIVSYLEGRGHLTASARAAPPAPDGRAMVLRVSVDPGPRYAIGEVAFAGAERLDAAALRTAAAFESGSPYTVDAVNEARAGVLRHYRDAGFADARVAVQQDIDPAQARVNVVFTIDEGPRQVLRDIVVAGNRSIDTDVITRALDLNVGEPLGADTWLQARSRLFDTALFRRVDVETTPIADAPPVDGERPVRVLATVQEWPALRLRYGFQVSEQRPEGEVEGRDLVPGFSTQLTRRTLFGRAISTGGSVDYQRRERRARVFASAPSLFGLPVESVITAYRTREEFLDATLLTDLTGVSWEQRVRAGSRLRLSYSYRYDRDHTFETNPDPDDFLPDFDETVNVARLTVAAVYDTRDDPLDSTRGLQLSSNVEYSADTIGSDVSFVKQLAQAYYFRPWKQVVFASAARLGLAAGLDGQTLILNERFFAGGARTVRGVREEGLGPRDFLGAAGGGGLLLLNQEVRFPVFRWFGGVAFVDAGNVFTSASTLGLGDLVTSGGMGLRVTTPFAILRVDYGRVWAGAPSDSGRWTFGIGQAF